MTSWLLLGALACQKSAVIEEEVQEDTEAPPTVMDLPDDIDEMPARRLLTRLSLDLRGVRPSIEEIEEIEVDPEALDGLIEDYLVDPRFPERVMDVFAARYRTRTESYVVTASDFGLDDEAAFLEAVGDEPLQILGYIAENDLPYTTLVTADWTMANEVLAQAWPVDYPDGAEGWQQVSYTDGRPGVGILSTSAMMWRYTTTQSNENRGRANAVSRLLLCNDYLSRAIDFDDSVDLSDESAIQQAITTNPGCVSCHNTLDPLSSYFYGFWSLWEGSVVDATLYHPERELFWQQYSGVEPSYFGTEPGSTFGDLGELIAGDDRFVTCAVEQVFESVLGRTVLLDDTDRLTAHREAFLERLTVRDLFRSVVSDGWYRAGDTDAEGAVPTKLVGADLLASQILGLTGYDWRVQGYAMLGTDRLGLRTLAGGSDGRTVTRDASIANPTMLLVQERIAEAATSYVLEQERELDPSERSLFTEVSFEQTSDDRADFIAQIQRLHLMIFGRRIAEDGQAVEANLALWDELYAAVGDPEPAWGGLLNALLRDPDFLLY